MPTHPLHQWLNGSRNYAAGLELLSQYPEIAALLPLLKSGQNRYTEKKMEEAIASLAPPEPPQPDHVIAPDQSPAPPDSASPISSLITHHSKEKHRMGHTSGYPPHLVELDRDVLLKMKRVDELRAFLFALPEGEQLRLVATRIVEIDREVNFGWEQLHFYARTGEVMPGTGPIADGPSILCREAARMMAALKNNPANISKNKKSTEPEVMEKVARWRDELDEAKEFMKKHLS